MFLERRFPKHSLKSVQAQSEAMRFRKREPRLIRQLSQAESYPKTCQWIEGEPKDRNFCGAATKARSSYCEHHHRICYVPAPKELTEVE